ncbi:hypothetical protein [Ensifer sp. LC163]|uniref:hypothetical protein n=1 Tax=Ensifer sp. LC163 TaxID=1120652 RepID=UPI000813B939|nr:hypothetical protein [Ensifer sp. LC163]OCP35427.1 hypothetical protein BC360_09095 [Ensifer sp. LC163]
MKNIPQTDSWRSGLFTEFDIVTAFGESRAALGELFDCDMLMSARRSASAGKPERFELCSTARVSLAIIHALWRHAGLTLRVAEQALSNWPQVVVSVARVVDFEPEASQDNSASWEPAHADPFQFFGPFAEESLPVAAVDEYIDLIDARFLLWRKPKHGSHGIAAAIHASQERLLLDPQDAAAQAHFLEAAGFLRRPAEHELIWLGSTRDELFRPTSASSGPHAPERLPTETLMAEAGSAATLATNYRSKRSVNISLAARVMKRRALGLTVR